MYTKVKIVSIEAGAQYEGFIWDYDVLAELENGEIIQLFDQRRLIADYKIDMTISIKISAIFIDIGIDKNLNLFKMLNIKKEGDKTIFSNKNICISVHNDDIDPKELKENEIYSFGRLDILNIKKLSKNANKN